MIAREFRECIESALDRDDLASAWVHLTRWREADSSIFSAFHSARLQSLFDPAAADTFMEAQFRRNLRGPDAYNLYAQYLCFRGQYGEALRIAQRFFDLSLKTPEMLELLLRSWVIDPESDQDGSGFLAALGRAVGRTLPPPLPGLTHRPVRPRYIIGFVSSVFCNHALAYFIEPILRRLDRKRFMTLGFSSCRTKDAYTAALSRMVDVWYEIDRMSDLEVVSLIRSERVDVLIDLDNHANDNRLGIFSARAAPVQISAYGMNAPTGLEAMDYRITDTLVDPEGSEQYYSESLIRTPGSHIAYAPLGGMSLTELLAPPESLIFGSFNNEVKLSERLVQNWCALLRQFPGSRLRMFGVDDPIRRAQLRQWMERHGLTTDRIEIRQRIPVGQLQQEMQSVTVALDAWPYGGGVTSAQILSVGVPVLTVEGPRAASRVTGSFLRRLELPQWILPSPEALPTLGAALIAASEFRALREQIRVRFRERFIESDEAVKGFQLALMGAIERARDGMAACSFKAG
jgi:hypothetical protein